jgi:large subunit ribosomal protein L6
VAVADALDRRFKPGGGDLRLVLAVGESEKHEPDLSEPPFQIVGVGFRATATGQQLELALGFSHPYVFELPKEIKVSAETQKGKAPVVTLESHDNQLLGQVAAKIRSLRKPEPYKGKGIKFVGEIIRRKAGKSASKK